VPDAAVGASDRGSSVAEAPGDATRGDATQGDARPGDATPGDATPGDATPGGVIPGEGIPGEGIPGEGIPGEGIPGEGIPGEGIPGDTTPGPAVVDADVVVECSTGTYVRALARDLGAALGVGGHLTALRRTRVGPYYVADATPLAEVTADLPLVPLGSAAAAAFPRLELDADSARRVVHGIPLGRTGVGPGPVAAFGPDGTFLALLTDAGPVARSLAVFVG
jgi:hypothetical protein